MTERAVKVQRKTIQCYRPTEQPSNSQYTELDGGLRQPMSNETCSGRCAEQTMHNETSYVVSGPRILCIMANGVVGNHSNQYMIKIKALSAGRPMCNETHVVVNEQGNRCRTISQMRSASGSTHTQPNGALSTNKRTHV